ncbi:MAG TPA: ABC transporter permease [Blastocatellia bacterium]|nr:ABC transporter permease [Blastocatellia bacterium]
MYQDDAGRNSTRQSRISASLVISRALRRRVDKGDSQVERPGKDLLKMINVFEFAGDVSLFGFRAVAAAFRRPFEGDQILRQIAEVGSKSLLLVIAAGFALGAVLTLHTRSTLVTFGATSAIPTVQALAFFLEIGPLVSALLVAGRVGSGIGAVLSNMRATEQIDAIESLSIDSFKFLVVPRIVACTVALPLLTIFLDFSGLLGGFLAEYASSRLSFHLYITSSFSSFEWSNFYPPTLKTAVFGFTIGTISSFLGYTTNEGAQGVGKAATKSVVISSLLIIVLDVLLIKLIFFMFPENAL